MPKLPYMPWYPSDYKADTAHLSLEEHGAYRMLLDQLWLSDGALSFDTKRLSRRLGITPKRFEKIWAEIGEFFCLEAGQITHKRITSEIQKAQEMVEKRTEIARKAAAKRWKKDKKNNEGSMPEAMPDECQPEPKGSGRTPNGVSTMNLPQDGVAALEGLHATCAGMGALQEYEAFLKFITGWRDGVFLLTGRYGLDRFSESLRRPLRENKLAIEIADAPEPSAPAKPKLKAIDGGKA